MGTLNSVLMENIYNPTKATTTTTTFNRTRIRSTPERRPQFRVATHIYLPIVLLGSLIKLLSHRSSEKHTIHDIARIKDNVTA